MRQNQVKDYLVSAYLPDYTYDKDGHNLIVFDNEIWRCVGTNVTKSPAQSPSDWVKVFDKSKFVRVYNADDTYSAGDLVYYNGEVVKALVDNPTSEPDITNNSEWEYVNKDTSINYEYKTSDNSDDYEFGEIYRKNDNQLFVKVPNPDEPTNPNKFAWLDLKSGAIVKDDVKEDVDEIASGYAHGVLLTKDGDYYSWGKNARGQLGLGDRTNRDKPTKINIDSSNVKSIQASAYQTYFLMDDGSIYYCGMKPGDKKDEASTTNSDIETTPVLLKSAENGKTPIKVVSDGYNSIILYDDGILIAKGHNDDYQLGLNHNNTVTTWTTIATDVKDVASSMNATYIVKNNGNLLSAGSGDYYSNGNGSTNTNQTFTLIGSGYKTVGSQIAGGYAIKDDDKLYAWGYNSNGQVGVGNNTNVSSPQYVIDNVESIRTHIGHSVVVKLLDGTYKAWGAGDRGQLDRSSNSDSNTPVTFTPPTDTISVIGGGDNVFAVTTDGKGWAIGNGSNGEIGDNGNTTTSTNTWQELYFEAINDYITDPKDLIAVGGGGSSTDFSNLTQVTKYPRDDLSNYDIVAYDTVNNDYRALNIDFSYRADLGTSALNDIKEIGLYKQETASNATTARNYPIANEPCVLEVEKIGSNNYIQIYKGSKSFYRRFIGGSWENWIRLANSSEVSNVTTANNAPTSNDDDKEVGSIWVDTNNDNVYVCADNSAGNAKWIMIPTSTGYNKTKNGVPDANDDVNDGYFIGDVVLDTSVNPRVAYVCADNSAGNAKWLKVVNKNSTPPPTTKNGVPDANDDVNDGYSVGDILVDTSTTPNGVYLCKDNTAGSAEWIDITSSLAFLSAYSGCCTGNHYENISAYSFKLYKFHKVESAFWTQDGNYRIRCQKSGKYMVFGGIHHASNSQVQTAYIYWKKNNQSANTDGQFLNVIATKGNYVSKHKIVNFNKGDYITTVIKNATGTSGKVYTWNNVEDTGLMLIRMAD